MRRIILLAAGVFAGIVLASGAAQARPDASIFTYPPSSGSERRSLLSPIPRETISYNGLYSPGTILISASERRLYFVLSDHQAIKYGVGVGRPGFEWSGVKHIADKREWPDWTPPPQMLKTPSRFAALYGRWHRQSARRAGDVSLGTLYRIHGSNEPDTIGQAVSSGCIRMTNDDVIDLYGRAKVGTPVIVLP